MKKVIISFFTLAVILIANISFAQKGAIYTKKELKNTHRSYLSTYFAGNNSYPMNGSFQDRKGNIYIYGSYDHSNSWVNVDDITISNLDDEDFILVKFDKDYKAIWAVNFNDQVMQMMKVLEGPDSLIYVFTSTYGHFQLGSLKVNNPSPTSKCATFLAKLDPETGSPISGHLLGKGYEDYHRFLIDAVVDKLGNLYVSLNCSDLEGNIDSIHFGNLSGFWRNQNKQSDITSILKYDKSIYPVWLHIIGAHSNSPVVKMSITNNNLIVCGHFKMDLKRWNKLFFDDSLITDMSHNQPYGQDFVGFFGKIKPNGDISFFRPWLCQSEKDYASSFFVYDMKTDPKGNIYCFIAIGNQLTKLDTGWVKPEFTDPQKFVKFDPDGYLLWIREPILIREYDIPFLEMPNMFVDEYGNSYYSFKFVIDAKKFYLDSIKYESNKAVHYSGLIKLDPDGNCVDGMFPPPPSTNYQISFLNLFKITNVQSDGTIIYPLNIQIRSDSVFYFYGDTLLMEYDASKGYYVATNYLCWGEITPKSQIIKEYSHPKCAGESNGYIHLKVIGGAEGHYLKWSHGPTDAHLDNLGSGTYSVSLYDSLTQQTTYDTFVLKAPPKLFGDVTVKDDTNNLSEGYIQLSIEGGTPPYNYKWTGATTSTSKDLEDIQAGSYTITVTDSNLCTWDTTVTVNNVTISIEELNSGIWVYPNPSSDGTINLRIKETGASVEVTIIDAKGQECFRTEYETNGGEFRETISTNLEKGNYIIKIVSGNKQYLKKLSIL